MLRPSPTSLASILPYAAPEGLSFQAQDQGLSGGQGDKLVKLLRHACPAREEMTLKVGAQVVLIKNIEPDKGLVNGARGIVVEFSKQTSSCGAFL
jgi:hypothetical protein